MHSRELKINTYFLGVGQDPVAEVSLIVPINELESFQASEIYQTLREYAEGRVDIKKGYEERLQQISGMTEDEILRQQLDLLAVGSRNATAAELPDLTDAMIKVLLAKKLENYIPCSRNKGYTVDGQPLEKSICHQERGGEKPEEEGA